MACPQSASQRSRESRHFAEAGLTCRPFTSGRNHISDGAMHNCSSSGAYIESANQYFPGTILILRMALNPVISSAPAKKARQRSIRLAEVRWVVPITEADGVRYGMGVRYLE